MDSDADSNDAAATRCSCGVHHSQAEHDAADHAARSRRALEFAAMKAVFPRDGERRRFPRAPAAPHDSSDKTREEA